MANVSADNAFWPLLPNVLDLTLKFEETVLDLTPSSLVIALTPIVIGQHLQQPVQVRRSPLLWIKLAVAVVLSGIEIAALAFRAADQEFLTETTLAAASVDVAAAVAVAVVLYVEHCHSIRSSAFLGIYLLIGSIFDAVKCRSFFVRPGLVPVAGLAATSCGLKMLLLILQEVDKRELFIDPELQESAGKESTSGYWKRMFFTYLNPTLFNGFRNILTLKDLSNIGPEFGSQLLHSTLKQRLQGAPWKSKNSLMRICGKPWIWLVLLVFVPRTCSTVFSFSQPFILGRIIGTLGDEATTIERVFWLFATMLSFAGNTLSNAATWHMCNRLTTRVRGSLVSVISEKNTVLPQNESKKSTAVTIMSNEVDGIVYGLPHIYEIVMTPFEVAFGIYALSRFVGRSCFVVVFPLIASTIATYFLGDLTGTANGLWNKSIGERVPKTSKILGQIKALKMFGLGPTIEKYLQGLREAEMVESKKYRILEAAASSPVAAAELLTPVVVIAAALFWDTFDGGMSAATVFPALSIVVLVKTPLANLLEFYPHIKSMVGCFERLQEFLQLPERQDPRTVRESTGAASPDEKTNPSNPEAPPLVEFVGASIAPLGVETAVLRDVSFSLSRGSMTVAVGPNGSGKSLLLQSILGETSLIKGTIYIVDLLMAFCGQQIWLRNKSIKQNIIGHLPYDDCLYRRVVHCCLLLEDFAAFPGGDDYIVGSKGFKLSGGQRQRIGLARALFARLSVIVLDDVFSSLDRKTAICILLRMCGEDGLLKELDTAVVLSSYLPDCIDFADQLLMFDGKGNVSVETNFKSEQSRQKVVQALEEAKSHTAEEDTTVRPSQPSEEPDLVAAMEDSDSSARQKGDPNLYWLFINPIGKLRLGIWCFSMFSCSAGEILPDIFMRIWIEKYSSDKSYFAGYASIAVGTWLLLFLTFCVLFSKLMPRAALKLHEHLVGTLMGSTLGYLGATDNGVLLNKFSQDMTLIARVLPVAFMRTFYVFFTAIVQTDVVVSGATYVAAAIPVIFLAVYCVQHFYLRTSRQMRALDLEAKSPLYTHFEETAEGVLYIRAFGWQKMTLEEGFHLLDDSQKAFYYMYCIQQWLGLVLGLLVTALATVLMTFVLFNKDSTSEAAVGLSFLNLIFLARTLEDLIHAWTSLETTVGALARLREFMDKTPQERNPGDGQVPQNWPSVGKVDIQELSAQYSADAEQPAVLRKVSLSIEGGQKVGLVGRTGSGKSSVFLALLGFLEYTGKIIIDGVDISSIPLDVLRSRIVTISQDQIRLDDTVRKNLLPFTLNNDASKMDAQQKQQAKDKDAKLEELLTRLGIWSQLGDKGLGTMLDDSNYSHGEMQLFCLVRGIMRHQDTGSKLVLIDEATSSVEMEREKTAKTLMKESFPGCTILVIGHRESSIADVDVTVELAKGEVAHVERQVSASAGCSHSG